MSGQWKPGPTVARLALAVALLVGLVVVPANASVIKPQCEDRTGTAEILGKVVDATSGDPIEGIEVCAEGTEWGSAGGSATTGADGTFEIGQLPAGEYEVGFGPGQVGNARFYAAASYADPGTGESIVTLADAQVVTLADQPLEATLGVLSGVVTFNGAAVPCASIAVWQLDETSGEWSAVDCTSADEAGAYSLSLEPGAYRVSAGEEGAWEDDGPHGGAWRSMGVQCEDPEELSMTIETFFPGVPDVLSATDVQVSAGQVATADIALLPNPDAATISGTVTGPDGQPVAGAKITAYAAEVDNDAQATPQNEGAPCWERTEYSAVTGADGTYAMPVLDGTYRLLCWPDDDSLAFAFWPNAVRVTEATDVVGTAGQVSTADFALAAGGTITGTLTDQMGTGPEDCAHFRLTLYREADGEWTPFMTTKSRSAEYAIRSLPAGTYRLRFDGPRHWLEPFFYLNAADVASATDIPVAEGATVDLDDAKFPGEAPSQCDAKPDHWQVHRGSKVKLNVSVKSCGASVRGARLSVYASNGHGWNYLTSATSNSKGVASVASRPKSTTTYKFVFGGKTGVDGSKDQVKVVVK